MKALDGWECWTLRTPTELESQRLDGTYTYGHPTEDGKETKLVPALYLATMDWSSAALDAANGRIKPLTDIG